MPQQMGDQTSQFDFSEFHPIDHWPWERRCRDLPGSWRNHLKIAWTYRHRDTVERWLWYRWARCPFGSHRWQIWKRNVRSLPPDAELGAPGDYHAYCQDCSASRPATEDEWW